MNINHYSIILTGEVDSFCLALNCSSSTIVPIVHSIIECTLVTWLKWWLTSTAENVPVDYWPVASAKIGSCNCSSPCRCVDVNMLIFIIGIIEFNLLTIVMESQLTTHHTSIIVIPLIPVVVNHSCPHSIVAHFHSSLHVTTTIHQSYISRSAVGWDWKTKKRGWRLSSDLVLYYIPPGHYLKSLSLMRILCYFLKVMINKYYLI